MAAEGHGLEPRELESCRQHLQAMIKGWPWSSDSGLGGGFQIAKSQFPHGRRAMEWA